MQQLRRCNLRARRLYPKSVFAIQYYNRSTRRIRESDTTIKFIVHLCPLFAGEIKSDPLDGTRQGEKAAVNAYIMHNVADLTRNPSSADDAIKSERNGWPPAWQKTCRSGTVRANWRLTQRSKRPVRLIRKEF